MQTIKIGDRGEQITCEELVRQGYELLGRNWKTKWAEIDIVARKDKVVYFVEVKYRATSRQGDGFDYITDKKLTHMIRAAELWVLKHDWHGEYVLLAAAIDGTNDSVDIREVA